MANYDGYKWYKFWIKSNRGTDTTSYKFFPGDADEEDIKDELEYWCSNTAAAAWTQSHCQYGYEDVTEIPKDILSMKINQLADEIEGQKILLNAYEIQQLQEIKP